jgi:hypothetical protein
MVMTLVLTLRIKFEHQDSIVLNTHFLRDVLEERIDAPLQECDNRERLRKQKLAW